MANFFSIFIGLICSPIVFVGTIPFLGWMNWLMLPLVTVGAILGALSGKKIGLTLNIVIFVLGGLRLIIGGGVV